MTGDTWTVRLRQTRAVFASELKRSFLAWKSLWMAMMAFAPSVIITAHALHDRGCTLEEETYILGFMIQVYFMRFAIFFGCLSAFIRAITGEVAEKTLHYAFLAPVRREVLVVGKFLAALTGTAVLFTLAVASAFGLMYAHFDLGRDFVVNGPGLSHLASYLLATVLACVGYGAVFLALSLVLKNPIGPAVFLLVWEGINGALPVWLKRFSVTYYLKPLMPVELPVEGISGLFTVVSEPMPAWLAVSGLVAFAGAVLAFACWRIRTLEVSYTTD